MCNNLFFVYVLAYIVFLLRIIKWRATIALLQRVLFRLLVLPLAIVFL